MDFPTEGTDAVTPTDAYVAPESGRTDERLRLMREALNEIVNASRDEGLAAMCNWMRGRAVAAITADVALENADPEVPS
jgi:hypothetical protein